ncbi:MAG: hypothetical protein HYW57_04385 [Ignavibacteriales bacterium]|nr:hypothetical protein [Ignavibacteriales bacterium]
MIRRSVYVIVNPNAGGATALGRLRILEQALKNVNMPFHVDVTESRGHAVSLASRAVQDGVDYIVAFGGDGTLNEVLNGLLRQKAPRRRLPLLGFVGAGSSNDFIRSFGGGNGSFVQRLTAGVSVPINVGRIDCRDAQGLPVTRYFLVNASLGIVARALEFFNRSAAIVRMMKRYSVDSAVLWSAINAIVRHESRKYGIVLDGTRTRKSVLTNLAILRGPNFGGGMSYGPRAKAPPGSFCVVGVGDLSKLERIGTLSLFYRGSILSHPKVWLEKAKEIVIESSERGIIEADGELIGYLPARFRITRRPVEMVY